MLAERFPDHAENLRELLPTIQAMADLSRSSDSRSSQLEDPLAHRSEIDPAGAATLGDFRIVRQIGRGGMGILYEAQPISLRRRVALKILPFAGILDQRQLARFKNESLAAAALVHPHIVPVHAVGCERGVHYYAMRHVDGHNLAELIRELRIREGFEVREHPAGFETESLAKQLGVPSHAAGAVVDPLESPFFCSSDMH